MTEEQRKEIFRIGDRIKSTPKGRNIAIYASREIVRVQHTKKERFYKMMTPTEDQDAASLGRQIRKMATEILRMAGEE